MAGEIVHVEFPAHDTDRAQRFWGGLFGWEFGPAMEGFDYRMARSGPESGVAVMKSDPGHPIYYFATDDIDAATARVRELGGTAEGKQPVPSHGWFAGCTDSEGNVFRLWQPDPRAG
jgi:predicted enzyme related to lactoylglutathione lyase